MADYTKSIPPILTAIVDAAGLLTREWRQWFSARQTFDNSLTQRWIVHLQTPITVVNPTTLRKSVGSFAVDYYPPGSPVRINESGIIYRGIVESSSYDSGTSELVLTLKMDHDVPLSSVTQIFYSVLASSVIP